jgi:rubredoxin
MRPYVVAAEVEPQAAPRAHALPNLGDITDEHGVALCGFPAERLTAVPGLAWEDVDHARRCRHCRKATRAGASA